MIKVQVWFKILCSFMCGCSLELLSLAAAWEFGEVYLIIINSEKVGKSMKVTEVESLYELGIGLIIVGVFILILAIVLVVIPHMKKGKVKAAGAVIIGPVPIIFGTDKKSLKTTLVFSIVLTALLIVAMIISYFLLR